MERYRKKMKICMLECLRKLSLKIKAVILCRPCGLFIAPDMHPLMQSCTDIQNSRTVFRMPDITVGAAVCSVWYVLEEVQNVDS